MQRGRGDLTGAIATLRQYLDHYMNDRESWEELADLYLEVCEGDGSWSIGCLLLHQLWKNLKKYRVCLIPVRKGS